MPQVSLSGQGKRQQWAMAVVFWFWAPIPHRQENCWWWQSLFRPILVLFFVSNCFSPLVYGYVWPAQSREAMMFDREELRQGQLLTYFWAYNWWTQGWVTEERGVRTVGFPPLEFGANVEMFRLNYGEKLSQTVWAQNVDWVVRLPVEELLRKSFKWLLKHFQLKILELFAHWMVW